MKRGVSAQGNELFGIHLDGKLIAAYFSQSTAKGSIKTIKRYSKEEKERMEVVRYVSYPDFVKYEIGLM